MTNSGKLAGAERLTHHRRVLLICAAYRLAAKVTDSSRIAFVQAHRLPSRLHCRYWSGDKGVVVQYQEIDSRSPQFYSAVPVACIDHATADASARDRLTAHAPAWRMKALRPLRYAQRLPATRCRLLRRMSPSLQRGVLMLNLAAVECAARYITIYVYCRSAR